MDHISNITLYVTFFLALYFEVFILINFLESKELLKEEEHKKPSYFPSVTIIVPVFNEEQTVTKTVFSLLKLDYPKDKLNIVIVDDGSTDDTPKIIKRFKSNRRITLIRKENGGKYTALNTAIKLINTDLVGCLDADSFVLPDTLQKIVSRFENEKIMAVTPAIKIYEPKGFVRNVQSNEYNLGIFMKKSFSILDSVTVTPGPFSIFRRKIFDEIGSFKEAHNTEDLEIAMRMQKNLYKIGNAHDAVVYTVGPDSIKKLFKQRVRWIHGFIANSFDYKSMLLKSKYGNLGVFILPMAIVSVFLFFASIGVTLINATILAYKKIEEIMTVGVNLKIFPIHFDWFFVSTDSKLFLSLILFITTIALINYGKNISKTSSKKFSFHTLYFPFVYSTLSIFWLTKAVYNFVVNKKTSWR